MPRLKSLELHGYKTFASKTRFEFAEGITSIVGPNGSGKSNIADAIRWVLGEQSYTLLRAKKTEDMIFVGSEQRPRAGMASAVITFDNSDGGLAIDYSEVSIARVAYRDGTNEYLLNDQRVRLKDIDELLAQCGLAERTYTIVGQGLVDAALALKPEERRKLFEEAAGIGLYRSRKEEAVRRLESTQHNLERVRDILAELQPRLRSLERQAKRASEHDQVREEFRDLLRTWYGYHWHTAQEEVHRAHQGAESAAHELETLQSAERNSDERLLELRSKLSSVRAQLNAWNQEVAPSRERREVLTRELAVSQERLRSFDQSIEDARAQLESVEAVRLDWEQRQGSLQAERTRLEGESIEVSRQLQQVEANWADRETRRQERVKRQASLEASIREWETSLARAEALISQTEARKAQLGTQRAELEAGAQNLSRQVEALTHSQEVAQREWEASSGRVSAAQEQGTQTQETLQHLQEELHRLKEGLGELTAKDQQLKVRSAALVQSESEMLGYGQGVRTILSAAQEGRISGAASALGSLLQIPAEIEPAISASLGEALDTLVLEGDRSLEEAIDLLSLENSGRASLVSLSSVAPPAPSVRPDDEEVLGVASTLIEAPAMIRLVVDLLLGQTVIVRSRRAARRVAASVRPGGRVVTLKGEVFYPGGLVTAGRGDRSSSLSRAKERRELEDRLEGLQRQIARATQEVQEKQARLQSLEERQRLETQDLLRLRGEEERRRTELEAARTGRLQLQQELGWRLQQRQDLEADLARLDSEGARFALEQQDLLSHLRGSSGATPSDQAIQEEESREEVTREVSRWRTQAALVTQALTDLEARKPEASAALDRAVQAALEREHHLTDLTVAHDTLISALATYQKEEAELAEAIRRTQSLIEPAQAQRLEQEQELGECEAAEAEFRVRLHTAERNYTEAQVQLARKQEEAEGLRHRIEDDFGLVEFDYVNEVTGPTPLPFSELVERLPRIETLSADLEELVNRGRAHLRRMGAINPEAPTEFREVRERFEFLSTQTSDLQQADRQLREVVSELDQLMQHAFQRTFEAVAEEFPRTFARLFGGGAAKLMLTDPDNPNESGIDILARLPGRRTQALALLSGGERSLAAVALIFSLLKVSPTPFCVLDEVDAMLDESNVGRFRMLLEELSRHTQFVVITHNRNTVQASQVIYGVSMAPDSSSQVISLRLDELVSSPAPS
ncbi:MAG: chromosome segregation protein SMC [Anaerolineales bacterium]|jgi:chromosome segregation protein